jgi:hypothetical protein
MMHIREETHRDADAVCASGFSSPYAGDHFMGVALSGTMPITSGELRHAAAFSVA